MQPSHGSFVAPLAQEIPQQHRLVGPQPRRCRGVQRNSLAFAAVTGAIVWKTWTARRQRSPQQSEKLNTKNFLSTGNLSLDLQLHGGLPKGRMVEIFGEPQSGKTSLANSCLQSALRNKKTCAVLDVDRQWPRCLAADEDQLLMISPRNAEEAVEMMVDVVNSRQFDLIILDSVAGLSSQEELTADMSLEDYGNSAVVRLMSIFCQRMQKILPETGTTIIFTNLVRTSKFGGEETYGGNAVAYRSSLRIAVRPLEPLGSWIGPKDVKAVRTMLEVVKNKEGPAGGFVECDLLLGKGISWESSVVQEAMDLEVLTEADNGEVMIFQGESKARSDWAQFLEDHPQVCAKLAKACRKAWVLRH